MVEVRRAPAVDCASAVNAAAPGERRLLVAAGHAARPALLEAMEQLGVGDAALRDRLADDVAAVAAAFLAAFGASEASRAEVRITLTDGQVGAPRAVAVRVAHQRRRRGYRGRIRGRIRAEFAAEFAADVAASTARCPSTPHHGTHGL